MIISNRYRHEQDDKHHIRNPLSPVEKDMQVFANTLVKTRIPDLFKTEGGLKGHAEQIQCEINRLSHVEGLSGDIVCRAVETSRFIRECLIKSKEEAARTGSFSLNWLGSN
jgi:hypothetical protein